MSSQARAINTNVVNGIDTDQVKNLAGKIAEDEDYGRFQWRAANRWIDGAKSRTSIQGFFAGKEENTERKQVLTVDADQPEFLAGGNTAPNSVEYILHALTSCLTVTLTYHAAVQGIALEAIETSAVGDMNSRGFFGISEDVKKGYERIRVNMRVKSRENAETLTALAMNSPVFEMISKAVPVEFNLTTD
jgi:uncharacterized OsmC-like protein